MFIFKFSGLYRGAAHQKCNLEFQQSTTLPVVFHNLSSYDAHLLITEIYKKIEGTTTVIPENTEKYITINKYLKNSKIKLQFIDSFKFLATSLETLANTLDTLKILAKHFNMLTSNQLSLLRRKGVFPYDYLDSCDKLNETLLPSMPDFFNNINMEDIAEEDYLHAKTVWQEFNINTLGNERIFYKLNKKKILIFLFSFF